MKLTIACDFDGVLHQYTSGWTGTLEITDPPVPGAIEWLEALALNPDVEVIIHTCRFTTEPETAWYWEDTDLGHRISAVKEWLDHHGMTGTAISLLQFWTLPGKPHASVYLDDRGLRFEGVFPELDQLRALRTWNKP